MIDVKVIVKPKSNGSASGITTSGTLAVDSVPWAKVTGTPTTIGGYGITDAHTVTDAAIRVTTDKVGYVAAGDVIPLGMSWEQILRKILYKPSPATLTAALSTSNDVEYGSEKGSITYTAAQNESGKMKSACYDGSAENVLAFGDAVNGVQQAVRTLGGTYTDGESYTATVVYAESDDKAIPETTLYSKISVNVRRRWFAGVVDTVPTTSAEVRSLSASGLYYGASSYSFTITGYKTFVICIPTGAISNVGLDRYVYNFMDLDSAKTVVKIQVEGAGGSASAEYSMYVFSSKTASAETDKFTFITTA